MIQRIILCGLAFILTACQIPEAGKFEQLHKGMSQSEVISLLGEPSSRSPAQRPSGWTGFMAIW
jgi:hypothetical protein